MPSIYSRGNALEVCQTQTCLAIASEIQSFMDFNANPCDDFYQFTCGNFIEHAVVDENIGVTSPFADGDMSIVNGISSILNGSYEELLSVNLAPDFVEGANYSSEADQRVFNFLKSYYTSCMDTATMDKEGPIPLYPIFGNIDFAASYGHNDLETRTALTIHADSYGAAALWVANVIPHPAEIGINMLYIDSTKYDYLPGFNSSNPEEVAAYKSNLMAVADEVFASNDTDRIQAAQKASFKLWAKDEVEARVDQVIKFQNTMVELSQIQSSIEEISSEIEKNTRTLAELQETYPLVNWETYFRYFVPSDRDVPETLMVGVPFEYLDGLNTLMNTTSTATFRDYLLFHMVLANGADIGSQIGSFLGLSGASRQTMCVDYVRKHWDIPMVRYYAMKYFGGAKMRDQLYQVVSNVHQAWANRLERADWLDETTLANARDKINKIGQWVEYNTNYPDDRTPAELSEYLGPIEFNESFLSNQLLAKRFTATKRRYMDVGKPVNRENFFFGDITLLDFNAFYNPYTNYITILPGIVQDVTYNSGYPAYLNYGGLGATVGHEFTHGFDTNGRVWDGDGLYVNWWTEKTTAVFEEKTQCLVKQYNNMTVEGPNNEWLHVDGTLTLAENVADNGGIGAAYEAYTTYWNSAAEKMSLPGIDLTPDQLFFVAFARFFCSKSTPAYNTDLLAQDNHSPGSARVKGTLQNSVDFAKAYNCPVGSYMNPKEKCSVW